MRKERWAFSESELADPSKCKGYDELVAYIDFDDGFGGTEGVLVVVHRDGRSSNRYADGTAGIREGLAVQAELTESLLHPNGEDTEVWKDVETDKTGNFIQFLD